MTCHLLRGFKWNEWSEITFRYESSQSHHPSIFCAAYSVRSCGGLEPIPPRVWREVDDPSQQHTATLQTHIHTYSQIWITFNLKQICMSVNSGRNLWCGSFCWGDSADHWNTVTFSWKTEDHIHFTTCKRPGRKMPHSNQSDELWKKKINIRRNHDFLI